MAGDDLPTTSTSTSALHEVGGSDGRPGPGSEGAPAPTPVVRAAGGAVWRRRPEAGLEVVLVHRPRYNDWSLPKGKVDPGESDEEAAVREVREEASVVGRLGPELDAVHYIDRLGRPKLARYWAMTVLEGEAGGDNEVDRAEWLALAAARERLSYPRDLPVLDHLARLDEAGELD
jgi:8-oxo-dGTP pyrophosphatase MutT (NUDIX family)